MQIKIKDNIKEFKQDMRRIEKIQLKYAAMVALTRTASKARGEIVRQIPTRFKTTKNWWNPKAPTGIKVNSATKDALVSEVFTMAYFLPLQETGGVKRPMQGAGLLAPSYDTPKYGRNAKGAKRLLKTKKILRRGGKASGSPIMKMQSGRRGVFRRLTKKRLPIQLIYSYIPMGLIKARFGFVDTCQRIGADFDRELYKSFKEAMRNLRR